MHKCQYCQKESDEEMFHGYLAMTLPIESYEEKLNKWGRNNWWKNLERTDLTEEETKELDDLNSYDQALNTVGKGTACMSCLQKEEELYNKYYPQTIN